MGYVVLGTGGVGSQVIRLLNGSYDGDVSAVFNSSGGHGADAVKQYRDWLNGKNSGTFSTWLRDVNEGSMKVGDGAGKGIDGAAWETVAWNDVLSDPGVDTVFVALPSEGKYHPDKRTLEALESGKNVVSCEKYTLANRFSELVPYIRSGKYGFTATVGGGTGIPRAIMEDVKKNGKFDAFYGIINGTTNHILTRYSEGIPLEDAAYEAVINGYAEKGSSGAREVIWKEIEDVRKKATIIYNLTLYSAGKEGYISESDIKLPSGGDKDAISYLEGIHNGGGGEKMEGAPKVKLLACVRKRDEPSLIKKMITSHDANGYVLEIGFAENPPKELGNIDGVYNGAVVLRDGVCKRLVNKGHGAGAEITAKTMIGDLARMTESYRPAGLATGGAGPYSVLN